MTNMKANLQHSWPYSIPPAGVAIVGALLQAVRRCVVLDELQLVWEDAHCARLSHTALVLPIAGEVVLLRYWDG